MPDEADKAEPSNRAVIQPARLWPVHSPSVAKAELLALEMLAQGISQYRVRIRTKLTARNISRLAAIVAEDAADPQVIRIVGRSPLAQGTVRTGTPPRAPRHAVIQPSRRGPLPACQAPRTEVVEPEQMTFDIS